MKLIYFVKFANNVNVDKFHFDNFEEMWHELREFMLRNNTGPIEWMIKD